MAAETARQFEALERQAQTLMAVFTAAGHEAVAPAMIQPAGVFLDEIGEALRARTYVFTDPEGVELCLRPDLTVPTCRLHLARDPLGTTAAKYCYNGPAFRFQAADADAAHPREFRQAGIERFGEATREAADAETVALIVRALAAAGMKKTALRLGDLGLFHALIGAVAMPERWRKRLAHHFWRRDAFRAELKRLTTDPARAAPRASHELLQRLGSVPSADAEDIVARHLEDKGIELVGARTLAEITDSLMGQAADARARPLPAASAELIDSYVAIATPAREAGPRLAALAQTHKADLKDALARFDHRLASLANAGVDLSAATFSAEFGRNLEYYTGFVFEVISPRLGPDTPIAGGGRYDGLMKAVGAPRSVPAVGAAIHTERLLAAVNGGAS